MGGQESGFEVGVYSREEGRVSDFCLLTLLCADVPLSLLIFLHDFILNLFFNSFSCTLNYTIGTDVCHSGDSVKFILYFGEL